MADSQGCGYHRCLVPLGSLVESGVADGRVDMALWPDQVIAACAPDAIVFQRQVEDGAHAAMRRWRDMLPGTLFVYELDDYLGEIPAASFHAGFMPPNVEEKVAAGLAICDRATTTTPNMAEWLRSIGGKDVRVMPTGISAGRIKEREPRANGKLRIGFAGGLSHGGDLEIIRPAMAEIGDAVDWVFFGTQPDDPPCRIEYHDGVPVTAYMDVMAKLDVDLYLAPLEDNRFNRCKSNLRLIEAAATGACVVAQDLDPYRIDNPPVFAHATTPEEWTAAIRRFVESKPAERRASADRMRAWVGRNYVLERMVPARMDAWLPNGLVKWRPVPAVKAGKGVVVSCAEDPEGLVERLPFLRRHHPSSGGLVSACERAVHHGEDVLWLRPSTSFGEGSLESVRAALHQAPSVASAVPLASDGANAFPVASEWMPMSGESVACMRRVLSGFMRDRRLSIAAPSGPFMMLSYAALSMLGVPDVAGCEGNEEQAILEWGLRAAKREWKHMQAADAFASSLAPPLRPLEKQAFRLQSRGFAEGLHKPSEQLSGEERERMELALLASQWGCPRPGSMGFGVDYASWKALFEARRKPEIPLFDGLDRIMERVPVVTVARFGELAVPFGWVVHVDDTVELAADAVDVFARAIADAGPGVRIIYADSETKFPNGSLAPEFKPDFDLEFLLADDYVTPVCAVRTNRAFASRIELFAHVLDVALNDGAAGFAHVRWTLGAVALPTKPEEMALDALQRQIAIEDRLGESVTVEAHKRIPGALSVVRHWRKHRVAEKVDREPPLVSIVVPTLGRGRLLQPCVNTIRQHTTYPNWEMVVVHNGDGPLELGHAAENDPRVRAVRWDGEFNWSAINNWAIREHCDGRYVVTLNDDTSCGSRRWLDNMMGHAVLPDVGVVGARLVHPQGIVQHAGVICHNGIAGHMHKGMPNGQPGHLAGRC